MAGPLLVTDAPHLLYRAFYALPDSITGPDGQPTNALLGSVNVTLQVIEEHAPRAVVMCFGAEAAEYRTDAFPAYHADRPPMPDGLADAVGEGAGAVRGARVEGARPLRARGRRPDALARAGGGARGRQGADLHRRPRHVPVRDRERPRADAAGAQGLHRDGAGGGARVVRDRARAGAGLHRAARRPVRRAARAPRASAPRRRPTSSSARATSSTRSSARSARSRRCGAR